MRILNCVIAALFLGLGAVSVSASERESYSIGEGLSISFSLPGSQWQVSARAPEMLVRDTVAHVRYHFEEDGRDVPPDLEMKVRQRLAGNELFVFNPSSGAHLDVDFSASAAGEAPPSEEAIAGSARAAAAELGQEKDLSDVRSHYGAAPLSGTGVSYRVDATYLKDGEPRTFIGYIAAVRTGWLFLYYTDKQENPRDLDEIEKLFENIRVVDGN